MSDERRSSRPTATGRCWCAGRSRMRTRTGEEVAVGRRTVALCRCGKSQLRPFCDGTHRVVGFTAPSAPEGRDDDPRPAAGPLAAQAGTATAPSGARSDGAPASQALEQVARPARLERRPARSRPRARRPRARAPARARPPARSTAATASWTASASTCSSKKSVASGRAPRRRSAVAVAPVGHRRRHLEEREVADDRAPQPPVQAQQRHEVHRGQGHAGQQVEVRAVGAVEAERRHGDGEELGVDAVRAGRRRTRRPGSPRARPWAGRSGGGSPRSADRPP